MDPSWCSAVLGSQTMEYAEQRIPVLNEFCVVCDEPHVFQNGPMLRVSRTLQYPAGTLQYPARTLLQHGLYCNSNHTRSSSYSISYSTHWIYFQ